VEQRISTQAADRSQVLENRLWREARAAGFDAIGILDAAAATNHATVLHDFVAAGRHGEMAWMAETQERRAHPQALWPEARSVVMLGMSYAPAADPLPALAERERGVIAVYARGKDYHSVVNKRLKRVAGWLHRETGAEVKVFVDTAPLMEKPLAAQCGIGWQGRHSNVVSRDFGAWLCLGAILTTARLAPSAAEPDHCGSCRACLSICPTGAIDVPYRVDARRCISYLTIEHKGHIDRTLRPLMGNRIFGCDDCLAVCPWNKFARAASEARFHARPECDNPRLAELIGQSDAEFRARFQGTPVKRATRDGLQRNVLIACGNSGERALVPRIVPLVRDEAAIVRAAAVWALARLMEQSDFAALRSQHAAAEIDAYVRSEWERGEDE
jgi:epoxyqueuosine reductase